MTDEIIVWVCRLTGDICRTHKFEVPPHVTEDWKNEKVIEHDWYPTNTFADLSYR